MISSARKSARSAYENGQLTVRPRDPLISTLSANLTLDGLLFSFAFFAADKMADFRVDD